MELYQLSTAFLIYGMKQNDQIIIVQQFEIKPKRNLYLKTLQK